MDEYKKYLYERNPAAYKSLDPGDLTKQKAIREKWQCKSFKWFMEEIAFDLPKKYPMIEPPDFAWGAIQSISHSSLCVDTLGHRKNERVGLYPCSLSLTEPNLSQFFVLSWHKDIRNKGTTKCWDVSKSGKDAPVIFYDCHGAQGNQLWHYDPVSSIFFILFLRTLFIGKMSYLLFFQDKKWLIQGTNNRCLDCNPINREIFVNDCDKNNKNMQWKFGRFNRTALDAFDQHGVISDEI